LTGGEKVTQYMIEGNPVDTERSTASWPDVLDKHEAAYVSKYTGSAYHRATLYKSRRGGYYMEHKSALAREPSWAEWVSPERAAEFFLRNKLELPLDLQQYYARIRSVVEKATRKLEDAEPREIAVHLADHVTDFCHHCAVILDSREIPSACVFDERLEHCLANDTAGTCAKHKYTVNKSFKPEDYRHWNVAEIITEEELNELMRANQ
jgi:hypothetical protein